MSFEFWPAFWSGVVGGAAMVVMRQLLKHGLGLNLKMDVLHLWGSFTGVQGHAPRIVGLLIHLVGTSMASPGTTMISSPSITILPWPCRK